METTYTITVTLCAADPQVAVMIRNEIVSNLQSIRPLEASYQVSRPEKQEAKAVEEMSR